MPVYQNEQNLSKTNRTLVRLAAKLKDKIEIIYVDDGSSDRSFTHIRHAVRENPEMIRAIRFSRNFGQRSASLAGIREAKGDALVILSADLQDPPELISKFIEQWKKGYALVAAVRKRRSDGVISDFFSNLFYKSLRRFAEPDFPPGGFDFCLMDKRIYLELDRYSDRQGHLMLQAFRLGLPTKLIPYERQKRTQGKSTWTFGRKLTGAYDSILSNSYVPIRFISAMGAFSALGAFAFGIWIIISWLSYYPNNPNPDALGWPSLMVALCFFSSAILLSVGILGEYLWRVAKQVSREPGYYVAETLGQACFDSELLQIESLENDEKSVPPQASLTN